MNFHMYSKEKQQPLFLELYDKDLQKFSKDYDVHLLLELYI